MRDLNSTRIALRSPLRQLSILSRVIDSGTPREKDRTYPWMAKPSLVHSSHIQTNQLTTIGAGVSSSRTLPSSLLLCGLCHHVVVVRVLGLRRVWRFVRSAGSYSGL